jgi:hypothetical protein
MALGACDAGAASFAYNAAREWWVVASSGDCLDVENTAEQAVGSWQCGSGQNLTQPNQQWSRGATGTLVSELYSTCITPV